MSDPMKNTIMTPLSDSARREGMRWRKKNGSDMGGDDEPSPESDPFPRDGTKAEQEQWRRREENRKKRGMKIVDPLRDAMTAKPKG